MVSPADGSQDGWAGVMGSSNPVSSASRLRSLSWKLVSGRPLLFGPCAVVQHLAAVWG